MKNFCLIRVAAVALTLWLVAAPRRVLAQPPQPLLPQVQPGGNDVPLPQVTPLVRQTPQVRIETDVREFCKDAFAGDILETYYYIDDARGGYYDATEWPSFWHMENYKYRFTVTAVHIDSIHNDRAQATVTYQREFVASPDGPRLPPDKYTETLQLVKRTQTVLAMPWLTPGTWTVVVGPPAVVLARQGNTLERQALFFKQEPGLAPFVAGEEALVRLRRLGLAATQFALDYDHTYAFDDEHVEDALGDYLKGAEANPAHLSPYSYDFQIADTKKRYSFNDRLSGQTLQVVGPQAVLFYDGSDERLDYRYNGKAAVGLADGSAELVTPKQAAELQWGPGAL